MEPKYQYGENTYTAAPVRVGDAITLDINGHEIDVRLERRDNHHSLLTTNGQQHEVFTAQDGDKLFVHLDGKVYELSALSEFAAAGGADGADGSALIAPMPGVVLDVEVAVGDAVTAGQTVMLIESMKLQTELKAPADGTVADINLEAGQSFDKGALLIGFDLAEEES